MTIALVIVFAAALAIALYLGYRTMTRGRPATPSQLRRGKHLPSFETTDEQGNAVRSADLRGVPAVILFVRGNWCPFCTRQVKNLASHYQRINELGARLVLITPKPLETTRRVAEFFEIDFDFWLDEDLAITKLMGLFLPGGVPDGSREEYGENTLWPASLVVDARGTIRYCRLSRMLFDRPSPDLLVRELEKLA